MITILIFDIYQLYNYNMVHYTFLSNLIKTYLKYLCATFSFETL